ncbi:MAG TPA: AAA family ATPase [Candidatus Deferrimicrobium sp.]|nr:AAA family ATPase [Candidatus Deferrimicrobium sp.]
MIITKLELENWMKIRKLPLEFHPGINLIYGPNEIGKSSIIEAIKQAILGDPNSGGREYKQFQPWGTTEKARVNLSFTTRDGLQYHLYKSFPKGEAGLYAGAVKLSEEPAKTQLKLFEILALPEKTAGLFDLLFIHQGTALNIFDKKKNPLDDETRSHIKNVIKETAFKSLQQFQDQLNQERDVLFTNPTLKKFKSGKNAPEYIRLLEKERELNQQLSELEEKAAEFSQRLEEMETLDKKIQQSIVQKEEVELHLETLKIKETQWEELEKKQLAFKPFAQEYKRFLEIEEQLGVLYRELPAWYAGAEKVIAGLETGLKELGSKCEETRRQQTALKLKKEAGAKMNEWQRSFEILKNEYLTLQHINKSLQENEQRLPVLFALNKKKSTEKAGEIEAHIQDRLKKQELLQQCETQLSAYPVMTSEVITYIKKIAAESGRLENRLEDARAAFKMKCIITPQAAGEIHFKLKTDASEWAPHSAMTPIEVENFQRLSFQYPGEFDLELTGSPANVDIESLRLDLGQKQEELKARLAALKVDSPGELEKKFQEYLVLKNNGLELQNLLQQMPSLEELEIQKAEIMASLEEFAASDVQTSQAPPVPQVPQDPQDPQVQHPAPSAQALRDEWTKAKTVKDSLTIQMQAILKGRSFETFASEYAAREKEFQQLTGDLMAMEPLDIREVTQDHLDEAAEKLNRLEQEITAKIKDKELLTSMAGRGEFEGSELELFAGTDQKPQQIRETIYNNRARLGELQKQREECLAGRKPENIKLEYDSLKNTLDTLAVSISALAPVEINRLEEIKKMILDDERQMKRWGDEIEKDRSRRAQRSGELSGLGGLGGVIEEKSQVLYSHGKVLAELKTQLVEIYSLKLLLKLIEEEKEKAQEEVFKPLELRVTESFDRLIPGRYRLDMDNDLRVGVSARTIGGKVIAGVDETLSFGTREQLSFLLRLAIAGQLSRKEPQVMVLDDSFVNTDSTRLPSLLEMIEQSAPEIQFLIFTCRENDYFHYKEKFHTINLEHLLPVRH